MTQDERDITENNSFEWDFSTPVLHNVDKNILPGQLLQKYRQRAGLNQKQLAAFLDLRSRRMVQGWESNDNLPRPERLQKLIELYINRYIFTDGKQYQEARQLWEIIKDYSDTKSNKLSIYPIFDDEWFKSIINKRLATTTTNLDTQPFLEQEVSGKTEVDTENGNFYPAESNNQSEIIINKPEQERRGKNISEAADGFKRTSSKPAMLQADKTIPTGSDNKISTNVPNSLAISNSTNSQLIVTTEAFSRFPKSVQPTITTLAPALNDLEATSSLLVGRQQEIKSLIRLLHPVNDQPRLVTLTGLGGVGKTTLALHLAERMLQTNSFEDGVVWLSLATVRYPEQLVESLAIALNLTTLQNNDTHEEQKSLFKVICTYLYDRRLLLVLDNFEQIIEARTLIADLLKLTEKPKVLITSRCVLDLPVEQQYSVLPLAGFRPGFDASTPFGREGDAKNLAIIGASPAVELFVKRVKQTNFSFELTTENALLIVQICDRLEGLPLAIEIAASRVKLFSLPGMLQRLHDPLNFLGSKAVSAETHQRTLYATLNWSYNLLDASEQQLFRCFGLFVGGSNLHTLEWLANHLDLDQNGLELVYSLINNSLLTKADLQDFSSGLSEDSQYYSQSSINSNLLKLLLESRFRMLEIVREFALEQLQANSDEIEQIILLMFEYYLEIFPVAESALNKSEQLHWLKWFSLEYPNIRLLLDISTSVTKPGLSPSRLYKLRLKLIPFMRHFWVKKRYFNEGCTYLDELLREFPFQDSLHTSKDSQALSVMTSFEDPQFNFDYAKALEALALLNLKKNSLAEALVYLAQCQYIYAKIHDRNRLTNILNMMGIVKKKQGRLNEAKQLYQEALLEYTELDNKPGIERIYFNLGNIERLMGNYSTSVEYYNKILITRRQNQDVSGVLSLLNSLGLVLVEQGNYKLGEKYLKEALSLQSQTQEKSEYSQIINNLGMLAFYQNDYGKALPYYKESLEIDRELGIQDGVALTLHNLAQLYLAQGKLEEARQCLEESLLIIEELDAKNITAEYLYYYIILVFKELNPFQSGSLHYNDLSLDIRKKELLNSLRRVIGLYVELGNKKDLAFGLSALARYNMLEESWKEAVVLFSFAIRTLDELERKNDNADWKQEYDTDVALLKQKLSLQEFEESWQEGRNISLGQLLESETTGSFFLLT
jgi:predicted ATPase/tetratricopeptide (TPR) repeat protein/transcriptional regulator with XRE-family HTH domain